MFDHGLAHGKEIGRQAPYKRVSEQERSLRSIGEPCEVRFLTNRLLNKIGNFGTAERKLGVGRPRSVRTVTNIWMVEDVVCSQDDAPYSHKSPREVARETGISRSSAVRIVKMI